MTSSNFFTVLNPSSCGFRECPRHGRLPRETHAA
jgi:hypothetical protein